MMSRYILCAFILLAFGCKSNKITRNIAKSDTAKHAKSTNKKVYPDTIARYTGPDDTVPKVVIPEKVLQIALNIQPIDTNRNFLLSGLSDLSDEEIAKEK